MGRTIIVKLPCSFTPDGNREHLLAKIPPNCVLLIDWTTQSTFHGVPGGVDHLHAERTDCRGILHPVYRVNFIVIEFDFTESAGVSNEVQKNQDITTIRCVIR